MSNYQWYKNELAVNKQLFELGLISKDERHLKDLRAKALYISQKRDEE